MDAMEWIGAGLAAVAAVAILAVFPLAFVVRLKRRREMRRLANDLGFTLARWFGPFPSLEPGRLFHDSAQTSHLMEGEYRGRRVIAYDAGPVGGKISARSRRHGWLGDRGKTSICLMRLDSPYPNVDVRPRTLLGINDSDNRITTGEVRFESDEFNRAFRVSCRDRRFVYNLCHPRVMEWLLARRGLNLAVVGGWLALKDGEEWSPKEFVMMFDAAGEFLDMIPGFVRQEYVET